MSKDLVSEKREIESLEKLIEYEEAMWENARDHQTDTYQFQKALADNRERIDRLHKRLAELKQPLTRIEDK